MACSLECGGLPPLFNTAGLASHGSHRILKSDGKPSHSKGETLRLRNADGDIIPRLLPSFRSSSPLPPSSWPLGQDACDRAGNHQQRNDSAETHVSLTIVLPIHGCSRPRATRQNSEYASTPALLKMPSPKLSLNRVSPGRGVGVWSGGRTMRSTRSFRRLELRPLGRSWRYRGRAPRRVVVKILVARHVNRAASSGLSPRRMPGSPAAGSSPGRSN